MELETKISVIMPVYNTDEKEFREAIESILNQTLQDFELIIVDDCSKDYIKKTVDSYTDSRIVYLRNEKNLGLIGTPNRALDIARGKYIARMDSDDISVPQRLEIQFNYMEQHPEIDILGSAFEKIPKNQVVKFPTDNETIKYTMIFSHNCICHSTAMIRKSAMDKHNIRYDYENDVCEDYGMWLKHIEDLKYENLEDVLVEYRWNTSNISKRKTYIQSAGSQKIMFKAQARHFNLDYDDVIKVINKYCDDKIITSNDLIEILNFALHNKSLLDKERPQTPYNLNRVFFKDFLKKCVSDVNFIKILFSKELDSIIKLTFFEKIGMILGF